MVRVMFVVGVVDHEKKKTNSGFLASEKIEERFGEKSADFLIQTAQSSGDTGTSSKTLPECGESKGPFP